MLSNIWGISLSLCLNIVAVNCKIKTNRELGAGTSSQSLQTAQSFSTLSLSQSDLGIWPHTDQFATGDPVTTHTPTSLLLSSSSELPSKSPISQSSAELVTSTPSTFPSVSSETQVTSGSSTTVSKMSSDSQTTKSSSKSSVSTTSSGMATSDKTLNSPETSKITSDVTYWGSKTTAVQSGAPLPSQIIPGETSIQLTTGGLPFTTTPPDTPTAPLKWTAIAVPIEVEIDGIKYMLPIDQSQKFDHVNKDNKALVLEISHGEVKITTDAKDGPQKRETTAIYSIPQDIGDGDVSINPKSGSGPTIKAHRGHKSNNKKSSLFDALKGLTNTVSDVVKKAGNVIDSSTKLIENGFNTAILQDSALTSIDELIQNAVNFAEGTSQIASDSAIELVEIGTTNAPVTKAFNAYDGVTRILNQLRPLQNIMKILKGEPGNTVALDVFKHIIKRVVTRPIVGALALTASAAKLYPLASQKYDDAVPLSSMVGGSSLATSSATSTAKDDPTLRKLHTIYTRHGTSLDTYLAFLKELPDTILISSDQRKYPHIDDQKLMINLTDTEVKDISDHPLIRSIYLAAYKRGFERRGYVTHGHAAFAKLSARADIPLAAPIADRMIRRADAPAHLKVLSQKAPGDVSTLGYLCDKKRGMGSTIYVLDAGYDPEHSDFAQGEREEEPQFIAVPNEFTLHTFPKANPNHYAPYDNIDHTYPNSQPGWGNGDIGYQGHGTQCASAAAGLTRGVAPNANLVGIKIQSAVLASFAATSHLQAGYYYDVYPLMPEALDETLRHIIEDVEDNGREGRAVISMSVVQAATAGLDPELDQDYVDRHKEVWNNYLPVLDALGIVFVCSAGNGGYDHQPELRTVNNWSPLNLETANNPILITGSVNYEGKVSEWQSGVDPQEGPRVRIYAVGQNVDLAVSTTSFDHTTSARKFAPMTGTSFAAPQVAGMIAYYMALDSVRKAVEADANSGVGLGTRWKNYIINSGHELLTNPMEKFSDPNGPPILTDANFPGPYKVAYNQAADSICDIQSSPSAKLRRSTNITDASFALDSRDDGVVEIIIEDGEIKNPEAIDWPLECAMTGTRSNSVASQTSTSLTPTSLTSTSSTVSSGSSAVVSYTASSRSGSISGTVPSSLSLSKKESSSGSSWSSDDASATPTSSAQLSRSKTTSPASTVSHGSESGTNTNVSSSKYTVSTVSTKVTTPSSSFIKTSRTISSSKIPSPTFTIKDVNCRPETKCVADVKKAFLDDAAKSLCGNQLSPTKHIDKNSKRATMVKYDAETGITFNVTVSWKKGCTDEEQHVFENIGCMRTILSPYTQCTKNNNNGGTATQGCAQYDVTVDCDPELKPNEPTCKKPLVCPKGQEMDHLTKRQFDLSRAYVCSWVLNATRGREVMRPGDPPLFSYNSFYPHPIDPRILFTMTWVKGCDLSEEQATLGHSMDECIYILDKANNRCLNNHSNNFGGFSITDRCIKVEMLGKCCASWSQEDCGVDDPYWWRYVKHYPDCHNSDDCPM